METNTEIKCPLCDYHHTKIISLSIHFRSAHKKTAKDLYALLYLDGKIPLCKCGCEEETKFLDITRGFREYKRGHIARINNNWGHNPVAVDNSRNKRKEKAELGLYKGTGFYVGKTKETCEVIKNSAEKISKIILNDPVRIKIRSERMKQNRKNGIVPTLHGPEHSQWKGGVTTLYNILKMTSKLYYAWKYPILQNANFKCERCNNIKSLHIHHCEEKMSQILRKIATEFEIDLKMENKDIDPSVKEKMVDRIVEYHIANNVKGIVLCKTCHKSEHASLNF